METVSPKTRSIRFDVFEVDLSARELVKRNRRVRLQELPFRLLEALIERPGETITRDELRTRLWGDAAVEVDDGLHTAVRKLREVLGDSATRPRFVETVPRRGYRFIGAVTDSIEATEDEDQALPITTVVAETAVTAEPTQPEPRQPSSAKARYVYAGVVVSIIAIAIAFALLKQRSATPEYRTFSDTGEAVPIAAERGIERSPALSPDGTRVAFSWSGATNGKLNLYVQNVDGTDRVRLTTSPTSDRFPTWSPDGRSIAFVREGQVFSLPAIGGPLRRVTTATGDGISWSPDGKNLVVSDREAGDAALSLYLASVDSGARRRLTFSTVSKYQDVWPAFSRQGDQVAFVRRTTTTHDVYRMPVTGGDPVRLAAPGRPLQGLAWTPDGMFVLAGTGRQAPGLLAIPAEGRDQTQLPRVDIAGPNVYEPSVVARKGGSAMDLVFGHETSNWDILGIVPGGAHASPSPLVTSIRNDQAPAFSPNGEWLAFNSARSGYEEIWVSRADGSDPRQLTHFNSGLASSPRWSPDGQRVAFDATIESNRDIYVIRGDGGVPQRVTREASSEGQPSWSHDGRWLYFMSDRSGSQQIWKMPAGGGASVQITRQGGYQALEAADGNTLYYAKRGATGLWRVPVNGGPETLVADAVRQNLWSMAAGGIYYFDITDLTPQVFETPQSVAVKRLDLSTGRVTLVATLLTDLPASVPALEVRPDGKYVTWVSRKEHTSEIMRIGSLHISAR